MAFSIRSLAIVGALGLASTTASAALISPFDAQGSSVAFLAFNGTNSYVLDTGLTHDAMVSSIAALPSGGSLTFTLSNFGSTYGLANSQPAGAYGSGISFGVFSNNGNTFQMLSTGRSTPLITDAQLGAVASSTETFFGRTNVANPSSAVTIAGVTADNWGGEPSDSLDTTFFGSKFSFQTNWDFTGASLDQALPFYLLTADDGNPATPEAKALGGSWKVLYSASLGSWVAQYSTSSTAPVPLPAAGWLLISGLASLGVIGRRRKTAA
jgi:hypothetical protein